MAKILLADDERMLFRDPMQAVLEGEGFEVVPAKDGIDAVAKFKSAAPDLVLLDIDMPRKNGYIACQEIRQFDKMVPIIFLTNKTSDADQLRGLGYGADDFVAKDSGEVIILARVRCALDRVQRSRAAIGDVDEIRLRGCTVNIKKHEVYLDNGEVEHLTLSEIGLLKVLYKHNNKTVNLDGLITLLRGDGYACEDSMMQSLISRLRRKLGEASEQIENVRGEGYRLVL